MSFPDIKRALFVGLLFWLSTPTFAVDCPATTDEILAAQEQAIADGDFLRSRVLTNCRPQSIHEKALAEQVDLYVPDTTTRRLDRDKENTDQGVAVLLANTFEVLEGKGVALFSDVILLLEVIAVFVFLWTSINRYNRRLVATLGSHFTEGEVSRVDFVNAGESRYFLASFGYAVRGIDYYGGFNVSGFSEYGFLMSTDGILEKLRKKYPAGYKVRVFYYKDDPTEHWLHEAPTKWAIFWKAVIKPLTVLVIVLVPLGFVDWLIILSEQR
ncbi:hypothetical protein N9W72_07350 [Luminiphilus sp.]|nr:hypothetical protein [Luminiphilus sp.]